MPGQTPAIAPALTDFTGQVAARLSTLASAMPESLRPAVESLASRPGKCLRAVILYACARFGHAEPYRIVRLGALIELLHLASLLHDDVVDRADLRRGRPAARLVVGEERAVLAGLACFAVAGMEAATLGVEQMIGQAAARLAYGEVLDVERAFDISLSVANYLELVERKTGELFRLACVLGGLEAGAQNSVIEALGRFGLDFGVAFQIPVTSLRLSFGLSASQSLTDSGAAVASRERLCEALRYAAISRGADHIPGRVTGLEPTGSGYRAIVFAPGSSPREVSARHVIMATGSEGGPTGEQRGTASLSGIACARRFAGEWLRGTALLTLIAPDGARVSAPPRCVWAIPGTGATITIGTAIVGVDDERFVAADLLDQALAILAASDRRFAAVSPAGPLITGVLDVGFTPERVASADYLLVGDAAGLVNPFTGEGLSLAIQSGLIAADAIAEHASDASAARDAYASRLGASVVGYFEAAHHAARRYRLTWRMLGGTARSDHPLFAKARRVVLLPEGLSALNPIDHVDLPFRETILIAPLLAACDEIMVTTVREQWPFLARIAATGDATGGVRLRPSVLFFASLMAGKAGPDVRYAMVAAAIEFAQLGALTFIGPPASPPPSRGVDWAVATAVLAGDFLVAQASRLVAESAPEISWSFAEWLLELVTLREAQLTDTADPADLFSSIYEFPARIGAMLANASADTVQALRDAGFHCGRAFLHAEDILALRGERTRLDAALPAMLSGRISAIPGHLADPPVTARDLVRDREKRQRALHAATAACLAERDRAVRALSAIPQGSAVNIFGPFIASVTSPGC